MRFDRSRFAIERAVISAGAEIGPFEVGGAKGAPGAGAEDAIFADVVHVNRNAQHRGEC